MSYGSSENGFLLIDCCISLLLLSLMISLYLTWHSQTISVYQRSRTRAEALLYARSTIERIQSGYVQSKVSSDDQYKTVVQQRRERNFCWTTVTVTSKNNKNILPVRLTAGAVQ